MHYEVCGEAAEGNTFRRIRIFHADVLKSTPAFLWTLDFLRGAEVSLREILHPENYYPVMKSLDNRVSVQYNSKG